MKHQHLFILWMDQLKGSYDKKKQKKYIKIFNKLKKIKPKILIIFFIIINIYLKFIHKKIDNSVTYYYTIKKKIIIVKLTQ